MISWFYFSINFGPLCDAADAVAAQRTWTAHCLWSSGLFGCWWPHLLGGRNEFIHIPPKGMDFVRETFSPVGLKAIGKLFGDALPGALLRAL